MPVRVVTGFLIIGIVALATVYAQSPIRADKSNTFDYSHYATVLQQYVDQEGLVNYRGLKKNRAPLDAFIRDIAELDQKIYESWGKKEKIAFWLNAYNALTLRVIIGRYPIKPRFFASMRFPKNSIRQIEGVWDKMIHTVMGQKMTLNDIEHNRLRKNFNEPRIHMGLNCASMGCPPLLNEPYTGKKLNAQLDGQTKRFMQDPGKYRIYPERKRLYLSFIFKWFGEDFVKKYGGDRALQGYGETMGAVLNFISGYAGDDVRGKLAGGKYTIFFLDYDWALNEQPGDALN